MLSFVLLATLCWSCQKDGKVATFKIRMEGAAANGEKAYINGYSPEFEVGEKVRINGGTYIIESLDNNGWATVEWIGGVDAEEPNFYGVYPASLAANTTLTSTSGTGMTFKLPQRQYYQTVKVGNTEYQKLNAPMCAYSEDYDVTFRNVCSVMHVRVSNNTTEIRYVDSIEVKAGVQLSGEMAVQGFGTDTPKVVAGDSTNGNGMVRLYGIGGTGGYRIRPNESADFYIYLPTYTTATKLKVKVYHNLHGVKYLSQSEQTTAKTLGRNLMFLVDFNLSPSEPIGPTPVTGGGGFTVQMINGQPSQKVYLGYGNLFHESAMGGAHDTFYVASYQFQMPANRPNSSGASIVDLFRYSQGTNNNYGVGSSTSYTQSNFVDWGTLMDPEWTATDHYWRTLTGDEWDVLVFKRPNASSLYGYGKITGIPDSLRMSSGPGENGESVRGCFFLPDDWVMPTSDVLSGHAAFVGSNTNFNNNNYTYAQWLELEAAGAIFLPYKGLPKGADDDSQEGNRVSYWAGGYDKNGNGTLLPLYSFCFHTNSLGGIHNHGTDPMFVRLAINVEYVDVVPPAEASKAAKGKARKISKR